MRGYTVARAGQARSAARPNHLPLDRDQRLGPGSRRSSRLGCMFRVAPGATIGMKTLANPRDREELLDRLESLRPDSRRRWGKMSAHQMVCHLSDGFQIALGEVHVSRSINWFTRTVLKWIALSPLPWPRGFPTRPEIDQNHE